MLPLRYRYGLYILLIHAVIAGLAYYILRENKWFFLAAEVGIILSILVGYRLYASIMRPIELMKTGVNAIKDEDYNVKFLKTGSRDINYLIDVFNGMLTRLGEERVRTQEQAYVLESLIEASPIAMIMLDYDDRIASTNPAAVDMLSPAALSSGDMISDVDHELVRHLLSIPLGVSEIVTIGGVRRYRCQTNTIIHRGFRRKFVMIEELSKELMTTERRAYGQVIRMMAHEVNNSMGAINSILQSVADFALDDEADTDYKESLEVAMDRNKDLALFVKRFAEVVKVPKPHLHRTDLSEIAEHGLSVMAPIMIEQSISYELDVPKSVILSIDRILIEQVLVNILKNSVESIGSGGHIIVQIRSDRPQLTVIDDGAGISPEAEGQLFTPFFSTKPTGQGVGLMLIREILMGHGAQLRLYTDREDGLTRFEISFLS